MGKRHHVAPGCPAAETALASPVRVRRSARRALTA
jgi:hypothetical protein